MTRRHHTHPPSLRTCGHPRLASALLRLGRASVWLWLSSGCTPAAPRTAGRVETPLEIPPLAGGGPSRADAGKVRFEHPPTRVGDKWTTVMASTSELTDANGVVQETVYRSNFEVEVLSVEGPAPSRVRVTFYENVRSNQGALAPTSLHGHEFFLDARDPEVHDAAGRVVPAEDAERVRDIFPDLGTRARVDEVLPEGPIAVGEEVDVLAAAILRILHPRVWKLDQGTARLKLREGEDAVFDLRIAGKSVSGMTISVTGEARVRCATSGLTRLTLEGTFRSPGEARPGTISIERVVRQSWSAAATPQ